jgi:hypothetical protein
MNAKEKNKTRNNKPERLDKGPCITTNKAIKPQKTNFNLSETSDFANRREIIMASDKNAVK